MEEQKKKTGGGIMGWMKDSGLIEDNSPNPKEKPADFRKATTGTPASSLPAPSPNLVPQVQNSEKEAKAYNHFLSLLEKADLPGPDFYEFYKSLKETMKATGNSIDERVLYTMVYTTLKVNGLKEEVLFDSVETYLKLLDKHFNDFTTDNDKLLSDSTTTINKKKEEMLRISTEISELERKAQNILESRNAFKMAHDTIKNDIQTIGTKCKNYLKTN